MVKPTSSPRQDLGDLVDQMHQVSHNTRTACGQIAARIREYERRIEHLEAMLNLPQVQAADEMLAVLGQVSNWLIGDTARAAVSKVIAKAKGGAA